MKKKEKRASSGIFRRWLLGSLSVAVLIVAVGLAVFAGFVNNYYYTAAIAYLEGRADTYARFISSNYMHDFDAYQRSAHKLVNEFRERDQMELQFINARTQKLEIGTVQMAGLVIDTPDVRQALETGAISHWIGNDPNTGERIVAVSSPLTSGPDRIEGVLRYVSSLERLDNRLLYLLGIGALVSLLLIAVIVTTNMLFIRSILLPIQEINKVTGRIAAGNYGVRIEKVYNDEIGELAAGINNMSSEISAAERMKSDFISSVSHELRTPLTAINGWGETLLLDDMRDTREIKKGIRIMMRETGRLSKMVEELLDFTRVESGRMTLDVQKIDIAPELEEILYLQMDALKREGIRLNYQYEKDIPMILGDRARLKQVFVNVIDNAAKHGYTDMPDGAEQNIDVRLYTDKQWVCVSVRDYGQGIPAEELPHVKYKFYKGSSVARGSGIGLAVSDEIISMHEGELEIESTPGEGTTVTMRIPAVEEVV